MLTQRIIRLTVLALAILITTSVQAQYFEGCGVLYPDVEGGCVWFRPLGGQQSYILDDYGWFTGGDTVFVAGDINILCMQWCGTWQAICLHNYIIQECVENPECCPSGYRGDANGDGAHDISDLACLVDYMFCSGGPCCEIICVENGDMDGNGQIDVSDITQHVCFLFMGSCGGLMPCEL